MSVTISSKDSFMKVESYPTVLDDGYTEMWFEDDVANVTKDGSDIISNWNDLSSNNNDIVNIYGEGPTWTSDGIVFSGYPNELSNTSWTHAIPIFVYIVFKYDASNAYIFKLRTDAVIGHTFSQTSIPALRQWEGDGLVGTNSTDLTNGTFGIARMLFDGTSSYFSIDEHDPVTGGGADGASAPNMFSLTMTGTVRAVIVRSNDDTGANSAAVYNYLKAKYGL